MVLAKTWKEASTLILVARNLRRFVDVDLNNRKTSHPNLKTTSEEEDEKHYNADYRVLTIMRSSKSSFFPNAIVFPGGIADLEDFSPKWKNIFERGGLSLTETERFDRLINDGPQIPMYKNPLSLLDRSCYEIPLPADVGYRINAIRETFEETGVLVACSKENEMTSIQEKIEVPCISDISKSFVHGDLPTWRKRVASDASQFYEMCKLNDIYPNIWALKPWSNWLTPLTEQTFKKYRLTKRYDTMFYITCVDNEPVFWNDNEETQNICWQTPVDTLKNLKATKLILGPPQVYEFSRLLQISSIDSLHQFVCKRSRDGIERLFPVNFQAKDGIISALPGDDLYPKEPNFIEGKLEYIDKSLDESRNSTKNHHRLEIRNEYDIQCHSNIVPKYNHLSPVHFM